MRIEADIKLGFKDVMIRPKRSTLESRSQVSLLRKYSFLHGSQDWEGIPIVAANMDTVGTFEMAKALGRSKMLTAIHKHYTLDDWAEFIADIDEEISDYVAISTGTGQADLDKVDALLTRYPHLKTICVDVANGYAEQFVYTVKRIRDKHPDKIIWAGNVVTGEMVEELLLGGADVIKVGIGPGSVCTTRVKTGVGYPQLSAVIECADAAHGLGGQIISDGGCKVPGDIAKAFGAGADFVMLGGMLAGHDESGGDMLEIDGKKYRQFYGMSSKTAMNKYAGGVANYRTSEGKTVRIPYKGPVEVTVQDILGSLRSTCTYVGARRLKELTKRTTFIRVQEQHNEVFSNIG